MKCPYCNAQMKFGRIEADNRLTWTPDGERSMGKTRWAKSPNSIILAEYYLLTPALVEAHYCEQCGKIVIDISDNGAAGKAGSGEGDRI